MSNVPAQREMRQKVYEAVIEALGPGFRHTALIIADKAEEAYLGSSTLRLVSDSGSLTQSQKVEDVYKARQLVQENKAKGWRSFKLCLDFDSQDVTYELGPVRPEKWGDPNGGWHVP